MKKPLLSLLLILISRVLIAQTYFGLASVPADNGTQAGPTAAIAPPSSMVAGDLVIIHAEYRANAGTFAMSATGGQTWTSATTYAGTNQNTAIFWCRYNGTWGANPSVTVGAGNTLALSAIMYVFRPSNSNNLWGVNVNPVNSNSNTTTNSINGVTTTASNSVTMAFWSVGAANTWGSLSGAGWVKPGSAQYRNTTTAQSHTGAYYIQTTTAGATGNVSQIQSTGTLALRTIVSWYEYPPYDICANAILITTDPDCVGGTSRLTNQTLNGANADGGSITSNCTAANNPDVWYKFVAQTKYPVITLSNLGASWTNRLKLQLLSGSCGSFAEVGCGNNTVPATSFPLVPAGAGLTIGNTYYIRILKNNAGTPTGGSSAWAFDICVTDPETSRSGRMNEVFKQTILSGPNVMADPWEITYGPDDSLWITEAKGYKVYRMDPVSGVKQTVLDISQGSTFFTAPADVAFNCQFNNGSGAQGGLAGLALHPKFLDSLAPKNYVYISYIHSSNGGSSPTGIFFTNRLVRFTFNTSTGKLESPVSLCDTLPGSNDHNSQRMIIAPVTPGGTPYLFYASGDMGSGQFSNQTRPQKAQIPASYEGKILRFNLESDGDAGLAAWIPNSNPYSSTSAVYSIGIRNNQGFAYDTAMNILYGSSHGPYSDDEINIIEGFKNYGHPLVIGYVADGNYNGTTTPSTNTSVSAGAAFPDGSGNSSCPPVGNEATNRAAIDANGNGLYKDPLFSAYPGPTSGAGTVANIWRTKPGNGGWPSEGWSGLDLYTHTLIPGWKKSLVAASLKWGRLVRIRLNASGITTAPTNTESDTISYFGSQNRYRDLAFAPNGKDIYVVMDRSTTSSGPSAANPVVPACQGCVQKYTFLGYADVGGKSSISTDIDVTSGLTNACADGTTITIDATNNNIWVPITGPDGNIMAEIKANLNNLGAVTSSFYTKSGALRQIFSRRYLHRNIRITPTVQPSSPVSIRLYMTKAEFDALDADPGSGISSIGDLKILKNSDACGAVISSNTSLINPVFAEAHGSNGYMLQANINSFSSFYFGNQAISLPVDLVYFRGYFQNNSTLLQWETNHENNTSYFDVERSADGRNFEKIGAVNANGFSNVARQYSFTDNDVASLSSAIFNYRLRMVDKDGEYKYSNIVNIYLADITKRVVISPNPASEETKVIINAVVNGKANWKLVDNYGRIVMQNSVQIKRGTNNFSINVSKLSAGLYFLKVTGAGIDQHVKLQKQ